MSQDEIVFDDVQYREPVPGRRPDRDRRWACVAYEVPGPDDLPIFIDLEAADAIERHALRDTSVELGGILLGKECIDEETGERFVWVTRSLEAKHYENTQASFTYTHESWEEITRERDNRYPDLVIVGWYHTHPDFGIFLSHHDMFIHNHFFSQPLQVAYVVDPLRQTRGFFRWRDRDMTQTGGFYLVADRSNRLALARMANDLENIPSADHSGGLGGISPRLEAELIAMLSRPATYSHAPAVDRGQSLLIFTFLGALFGMLGMLALVWLNALNTQVADQTKALEEVRRSIGETTDRQQVALDAALADGTASPDAFIKRYAKAVRERDEAKSRLENQQAVNDLLAVKSRQQVDELKDLKASYERAKAYEKDAKELANMRSRLEELRAKNDKQLQAVASLEDLLDTAEGKKAFTLNERLTRTWYAAMAGWAVAGVLALTVGYFFFKTPLPSSGEHYSPEPPHQIV